MPRKSDERKIIEDLMDNNPDWSNAEIKAHMETYHGADIHRTARILEAIARSKKKAGG